MHIEDVVEASMLALNCQHGVGEVINVGSGRSCTINHLARILMELSGRSGLKPIHVAPRDGDIRSSCADLSKTKRMLGYEPRVTLKEGLRNLFS